MAVADKLDTIAGMFAIGEPPTGSKDPFALRRSAIGVLNILRQRLGCGYEELVAPALAAYAEQGIAFDAGAVCDAVCAFVKGRMGRWPADEKIPADVVAAVSAGSVSAPADYFALAHALDDARKGDPETFENLATAYARASHLADASLGCEVDEALMGEAERDLLMATDAARDVVALALAKKDFAAVIASLAALREPVDRFFDDVMVMDEDQALPPPREPPAPAQPLRERLHRDRQHGGARKEIGSHFGGAGDVNLGFARYQNPEPRRPAPPAARPPHCVGCIELVFCLRFVYSMCSCVNAYVPFRGSEGTSRAESKGKRHGLHPRYRASADPRGPAPDPGGRQRQGALPHQGRRPRAYPGLPGRHHPHRRCRCRETFTVRKISFGVGVERTFPVHSPKIAKLEVVRHGRVRRAKLYYLRDRVGKAARIPEKRMH